MKKRVMVIFSIVLVAMIVVVCSIIIPRETEKRQQQAIDNRVVVFQNERMHYSVCYWVDRVALSANDNEPFDITVGQCNSLIRLNIGYVTLYDLDELDDLLFFPNLEYLDMFIGNIGEQKQRRVGNVAYSEEVIGKLSGILPQLKKIQWLYFGSDLTIFNFCFISKCHDIQTLIAENNTINDISALSSLTKLRQVFLGYNEISDITPLLELTHLEYISISGNPVCEDEAQMQLLRETFPNAEIIIN